MRPTTAVVIFHSMLAKRNTIVSFAVQRSLTLEIWVTASFSFSTRLVFCTTITVRKLTSTALLFLASFCDLTNTFTLIPPTLSCSCPQSTPTGGWARAPLCPVAPGGAAALITAPIIAATLATGQGTLAVMITHTGQCVFSTRMQWRTSQPAIKTDNISNFNISSFTS